MSKPEADPTSGTSLGEALRPFAMRRSTLVLRRCGHIWPRSVKRALSSLRLHEQPDQASCALDVLVELGLQLRQREAGRQFLGVEVGRDDQEGVVVRRA